MANLTIEELLAYAEEYVKTNFPVFKEVKAFEDSRDPKDLRTPAFFFECSDVQTNVEDDPETGETVATLRFEGQVICAATTPRKKVFQLALAVASKLRRSRLGVPVGVKVGPVRVLGVSADSFNPNLDQFHVYSVEWEQLVYLGESVFNDDGSFMPPSEVLVSSSPRVGLDHATAYEPLGG